MRLGGPALTRPAVAVAARGPASEESLDGIEDFELPDVPGDRDDQVLGPVALPVVAVQVAETNRPNRLRRAEDRLAERVRAPEGADEHLVNLVVGIVVRLPDLLEDDPAFDL